MSRDLTDRGAVFAPESRLIRVASWLILLAPVIALFAGCGSAAASRRRPRTARAALNDALELWKRGDSLAAPKSLSPPVRVEDESWLAGKKLVSFRIDDRTETGGDRLRYPVLLTLSDSRGKVRKESAVYDIRFDGITTVIRQDRP